MDEKLVVRVGANTMGFDAGMKKMLGTATHIFKRISQAAAATIAATSFIGGRFEQTLTETATIAQAFGKDLDALEAKAREIGKTTAFTATQAAKGMYDLASAGLDTKQIIDATEHAMKLAGATGSEMSQATGLLAASLSQFSLKAEDSKRVTDTYAAAITSSQLTLERLTEAMKYAGTAGAGLGWTIEETTAAVAQFANLGLEGSQAGMNLRMAMISLMNQTSSVTEALDELGLKFKDINPETHSFGEILKTLGERSMSAQQAIDLFGARAGLNMNQLVNLAKEGKTDFSAFVNMLEKSQEGVGRTAEMYSRMMDTFLGQWKVLWSAIQELGLSIFDVYKNQGKAIFTWMAENITRFAKWIRDNRHSIMGSILEISLTIVQTVNTYIIPTIAKIAGAFSYIAEIIKIAFPMEMWEKYLITPLKTTYSWLTDKIGTAIDYYLNQGSPINVLENQYADLLKQEEKFRKFLQKPYTRMSPDPMVGMIYESITKEQHDEAKKNLEEIQLRMHNIYTTMEKMKKQPGEESIFASTEITDAAKEAYEKTFNIMQSYGKGMINLEQRIQEEIVKVRKGAGGGAGGIEIGKPPEITAPTLDLSEIGDTAEKVTGIFKQLEDARIAFNEFMKTEGLVGVDLVIAQGQLEIEATQRKYDDLKDIYQLNERALADIAIMEREHLARKQIEIDRNVKIARIENAQESMSMLSDIWSNITSLGGKQSKEAFMIGKAFAIAEATMNAHLAATKAMSQTGIFGIPMSALIYAQAAARIAMIASQQPPSFDEGGISTKPGIYYSGVPEAHVPLKSGKIPVDLNNAQKQDSQEKVININLNNPTFMDQNTLMQTMTNIAQVVTMNLAPKAIEKNYDNDGSMRSIIRRRN